MQIVRISIEGAAFRIFNVLTGREVEKVASVECGGELIPSGRLLVTYTDGSTEEMRMKGYPTKAKLDRMLMSLLSSS